MDPETKNADVSRSTSGRPSRWRAGLLQFLGAVLAILVVGELAARAFPARRPADRLFVEDPELWLRLRPGWSQGNVQINEQGLREDGPLPVKPPGEVRVAVLGDSLVMGYELPLAEVFSERLEQLLGEGVRCVNLGVPGYDTKRERLYLQRLAPVVQPDVVVLVISVATDFIELSVSGDDVFAASRQRVKVGADLRLEIADIEPRRGLSRRLAAVSALWQRVRGVEARLRVWRKGPPTEIHRMGDEHQFEEDLVALLQQRRGAAGTSPLREAWVHFERELRLIRELVEASGASLLVVGVPASAQVNPGARELALQRAKLDPTELDLGQMQRLIGETCRRVGVEWLDLEPTLLPLANGGFIERTMHLSAEGHAAVAEALREPVGARLAGRRAAHR